MIELHTSDGLPTGAALGEWQLLVDEDPDATIFHTPRYLGTWTQHLAPRAVARIHTIRREGQLIGVVPEAHEREGSPTGPMEVRRFLGGTAVTDYLGPVARREDRDEVVGAYLDQLAREVDWDEFVAAGLAIDTGYPDAIRRHADRHGLDLIEDTLEDVCPRIDLGPGYDAYLESLPSKLRHEQRRKSRKLARDAGELAIVEVPADEVEDRLETFFAMAVETESAKSGFFQSDQMQSFFRALAAELAPDRTLRLHILEVGGLPAAATISLVHGREWGVYNSAFDQALAAHAPGMVLIAELIRAAAEEGCRTFDLLRGGEPYKYRFGAEDRPLQRLTMLRK